MLRPDNFGKQNIEQFIHVAMAARDGLKFANPVTNSGGSALQQGAELGGDVSEVGSSHLEAR
jgi:hypothetical protein